MASVRKSFALTLAQQYASSAISFVSVIVLARLLSPGEIGIYAVGAAIVGIAHMLRDFGIGRYLIQETDLDEDRLRTAFGLGIATAWTIAAVLYFGRGYFAAFYGEDGLRDVLIVLACNFLLIPFGAPILWLLTRDMKFGQLFVINISSTVVHSATSIVLAAVGVGYMSLAWASLAGVVTTTVLASMTDRRHAFVRPSFRAWRRVLAFGSWSSAQTLVSEVGSSATDLIVGRTLGFEAVGLYSRAHGLIHTIHRDIIKAVVVVAFPALAQRHRQGADLRGPFRTGTAYLTALVWPVIAFLALMSEAIIMVLFGAQWIAAAPILRLLCIGAVFAPLVTLGGQILLAQGRVEQLFRIEVCAQSVRIVTIAIGSAYGLEVIAALQVLPALVWSVLCLRYVRRAIDVDLRDLVRPSLQGLVVVLFAAAGPFFVQALAPGAGPKTILVAAALLWGGGWIVGVFAVRHPIGEELQRLFAHACAAAGLMKFKRH